MIWSFSFLLLRNPEAVSTPPRSQSPCPQPGVTQGVPLCQPSDPGPPLKRRRRQEAGKSALPQRSVAGGAAQRGRVRTRVQRPASRCFSSSSSRSPSPPPPPRGGTSPPAQEERWMDANEPDVQPSVHLFAPARKLGLSWTSQRITCPWTSSI